MTRIETATPKPRSTVLNVVCLVAPLFLPFAQGFVFSQLSWSVIQQFEDYFKGFLIAQWIVGVLIAAVLGFRARSPRLRSAAESYAIGAALPIVAATIAAILAMLR